ncbi:hypothetical protein BDR26DRAFT_1002942 [Obelidium mucronatum]|nr:hypothetical protein BDR26DRAFT_1002942 [Obelidium mucronatum]
MLGSFSDRFKKWANQDVNNFRPHAGQVATPILGSPFIPLPGQPITDVAVVGLNQVVPLALHDCRVRPKGAIADTIIDHATRIDLEAPPVDVVYRIVDMIRANPIMGAMEAAEAIFFKLYSDSHVRVHHTLIVLDVLYRNCGINFVHSVALYADLIFNFCSNKKVSQSNLELFLEMIAAWQTVPIDFSIPVPPLWMIMDMDAVKKMQFVFLELRKKGYPFSAQALVNLPETGNTTGTQFENLFRYGKILGASTYKPHVKG